MITNQALRWFFLLFSGCLLLSVLQSDLNRGSSYNSKQRRPRDSRCVEQSFGGCSSRDTEALDDWRRLARSPNLSCSDLDRLFSSTTKAAPGKLSYVIVSPFGDTANVEELLWLTRSIVSSNASLCIAVDHRNKRIARLARTISRCSFNANFVSRLILRHHTSYIESALDCFRLLDAVPAPWQHVAVLPPSAIFLRPPRTVNAISSVFYGSSDIFYEEYPQRVYNQRFIFPHNLSPNNSHATTLVENRTAVAKGPPPHGIRLYRGSPYGLFAREFAKFVCGNDKVHAFLLWLQNTEGAGETFWATVAKNSHLDAPGSVPGSCLKWESAYGVPHHNLTMTTIKSLENCHLKPGITACNVAIASQSSLFLVPKGGRTWRIRRCVAESVCTSAADDISYDLLDSLTQLPQLRFRQQTHPLCVQPQSIVLVDTVKSF